ncbi:MAG TPA: hypothetical protein VI685_16675 [Candidatus Angelobacter sp.]
MFRVDGWYKLAIHRMLSSDLILSFAPPAILVAIAIIFFRRKLHREFMFFFIYVLYSAIVGVLRETVVGQPFLYFWLYWITEAVYGILALLVLREVFHRIFALPYAMYRWFRFLLPITVLLILSISMWEMMYRPLGNGAAGRLVSAIYWFDLGVHALEGTILLLILGLTLVFPVAWRQYELGILTGFGIYACVSMLADLLRFVGGSNYEIFFRYGPPIAYVLATLIWLHAFIRPSQGSPRAQMDLDEMQAVVRRSRELMEKIEKALGLRRQALLPPV